MNVENFDLRLIASLWTPRVDSTKYDVGQLTIVGGSDLFHGAPILALKAASRVVSMVYFATPKADKGVVDRLKSQLSNFIWIDRDEMADYIAKSEVILVGPGMKRNHYEKDGVVCDEAGSDTRKVVLGLFGKLKREQKLVVDGGALQVVSPEEIPHGAVITPNFKEFEMLFGFALPADIGRRASILSKLSRKYELIILCKDQDALVVDKNRVVKISGGHPGLIKGGTGDLIAGLVAGLWVQNDTVIALSSAVYLVKAASESLGHRVGSMFNSDDLAQQVPIEFGKIMNKDNNHV